MQVRALLCDAADEHSPPIDQCAGSQYFDALDRTNLSPHDNMDALFVLWSVNPEVLHHRASPPEGNKEDVAQNDISVAEKTATEVVYILPDSYNRNITQVTDSRQCQPPQQNVLDATTPVASSKSRPIPPPEAAPGLLTV